MPESTFAPALARALREVITRNPLLSGEDWRQYSELLDRYDATVGYPKENQCDEK